jgi:hypothetical protein
MCCYYTLHYSPNLSEQQVDIDLTKQYPRGLVLNAVITEVSILTVMLTLYVAPLHYYQYHCWCQYCL